MTSTTAQRQECPRCHATFDEPSRFCRQCGADLTRGSSALPAKSDPARDATAPLEALVDRRLSDSNQAWLGKIVDGRYRVIEVLGRGGMGVVYRVEHLRMGKIAAMKVLHRDLAQDPEVVARFEREAAAVSKLHHPHTVQVFDFGNAGGNLYLIMELVRGLDMGRVIERDGAMAWSRAAPLFLQICGALQEAHELGIVHRDLKPENVLITRTTAGRDYAKVLDFGLAKLDQRLAVPGGHTDRQQIVGTPYFMAPEQIRGEEVDARTDIYSLGALMFEVLTATHLYTSTTAVGVLTKHLTGEPDAPSMRAPKMGIPPEVDALCRKALARDPSERWASAAEMAAAIEEIYRDTVGDATGPRSHSSRTLRSPSVLEGAFDSDLRLRRSDIDAFEHGLKRRRVLVFMGATLFALAAVGGAAWLVMRPAPLHHEDVEPNNEPEQATRIAPGGEVTGYLGKRVSQTEGDRDNFRVMFPAGSRRVVTVRVEPPPNIDINLTINDSVHAATADEGGLGEHEVIHRRTIDGPMVVTIAQTVGNQRFPIENVSDQYKLVVVDEPAAGEAEPNGTEPDATLLELTQEQTGYLDTRQDVDLVRWTGTDGTYTVEVRANGIPLAWRLPDGKPRTPGLATVSLRRGDVLRLERTDKAGTGSLVGRDAKWSIVVRN
ncbi:MAG: serine/threonine-protein kinase [Kofleriaceae bacterium]|nr:serine/threonine-protein kinase [Kofleriaceae bacterium]